MGISHPFPAQADHARDVPEMQHWAAILGRLHAQQRRALQLARAAGRGARRGAGPPGSPPPPASPAPAAAPAAAPASPRASPRSSADAAAPGAEEAAARLRAARGAVAALRRDDADAMVDALRPVGDRRVLHELRVDALGGDGLLHAAALHGAARCCAALLGEFRFPLDGPSLRDGALPLHLAAAGASRAVVALLLENGADANARSRGASPVDAAPPTRLVAAADSTPLHHCALSPLPGRPGIVDALLSAGADPHRRDEHGSTPLHVACSRGALDAARALLAAADRAPLDGAAPRARGVAPEDAAAPYADRRDYVERFSPLHRLVGCAQPPDFDPAPLVPDLVAGGADPDAYSRRGLAPAHVAAERGKARALAALLRAGADPALPQRGGCHETCVHLAVRHKRLDALRALLDVVGRAPAVVDARTTDGSTPLHLAAAVGSREAAEALLDAGADATARTLDGDSPLHVAAWTNALPVAEALLARGAEVDAVKRDGSTPLHLCASRGLYGMVTILLEAGADKRKTTVSGSTPADRAALFRDAGFSGEFEPIALNSSLPEVLRRRRGIPTSSRFGSKSRSCTNVARRCSRPPTPL